MANPNWNEFATLGGFRGVLDPRDSDGRKNLLLDRIQWNCLKALMRKGDRVLDFGCGVGRFASRISSLGISYTGVDPYPMMVETAKKNNPGLTFLQAGAPPLPFGDGSFDMILSCGVFLYLVNTPQAAPMVQEFSRLLGSKGRVVLLEQASASGQNSETADRPATPSDYRSAFSASFSVKPDSRVRCGNLLPLSKFAIRTRMIPKAVFPLIVDLLARRETSTAQKLTEVELSQVRYFDFLMEST